MRQESGSRDGGFDHLTTTMRKAADQVVLWPHRIYDAVSAQKVRRQPSTHSAALPHSLRGPVFCGRPRTPPPHARPPCPPRPPAALPGRSIIWALALQR